MAKRKTISTEEKKIPSLKETTFLDKTGKAVKLVDVIDKKIDCWLAQDKKVWILTHAAVEKIAQIAGISLNFEVSESPNVSPTYQNELEHIVRITIHCHTKNNPNGGCIHSENDRTFTVTGESNRVNTPHRGRGYLRKMAEKRGFDIAVLKHLGLHTMIFSEEEAEEFTHPNNRKDTTVLPGSKEFELIVEEINLILNAANKEELKAAGKVIKARVVVKKYSDKQYKYLKELFAKEVAKKIESF